MCNWSNAAINDGITHFNLLAFNGYEGAPLAPAQVNAHSCHRPVVLLA